MIGFNFSRTHSHIKANSTPQNRTSPVITSFIPRTSLHLRRGTAKKGELGGYLLFLLRCWKGEWLVRQVLSQDNVESSNSHFMQFPPQNWAKVRFRGGFLGLACRGESRPSHVSPIGVGSVKSASFLWAELSCRSTDQRQTTRRLFCRSTDQASTPESKPPFSIPRSPKFLRWIKKEGFRKRKMKVICPDPFLVSLMCKA